MSESPVVLVVDDHASARETIGALLAPDAYRLEFADGGADALARLEATRADLLLCDVKMPGVDGFEVCRALKSHAEWRLVPVILLTALDSVDDEVRGLAAGADDFLSKPLDGAVLRARTRAMLRVRGHYKALGGDARDADALLRARRDRLVAAAGLSERETEVLNLLLCGRAHDDIAVALDISERTSKFHQANILRKLGAESRFDLLRLFT